MKAAELVAYGVALKMPTDGECKISFTSLSGLTKPDLKRLLAMRGPIVVDVGDDEVHRFTLKAPVLNLTSQGGSITSPLLHRPGVAAVMAMREYQLRNMGVPKDELLEIPLAIEPFQLPLEEG